MKKIFCLFVLLVAVGSTAGWAQTHPVRVTVLNGKGKPQKKALVALASYTPSRGVSNQGTITVQTLPPDTLFVIVGRRVGCVPVDETTTDLTLAMGGGRVSKVENGQITDVTYPVFTFSDSDSDDSPSGPAISNFRSLQEYVTAKFSSVRIVNGDAYLTSSISAGALGASTQPMLIVVDGSIVSGFSYANEAISPSQVKRVVINKTDPLYGLRGVGGIMEITLKTGRDR